MKLNHTLLAGVKNAQRVHRMIPEQLLRYYKKRRIRDIPVARATMDGFEESLDVVLLQKNVLSSVARFSRLDQNQYIIDARAYIPDIED